LRVQATYPLIVTDQIDACRDFYTDGLGFSVLFEASWFVYMSYRVDSGHGIAFMSPDHPSRPPGPERFNGEGVLLTLQVEDAAAERERVREAGLAVDHELTREAWGQLRFGLRDPAGVWVDIVEQIEPEAGFWDPYLTGD